MRNFIITIFGQKHTGKTFLANGLFRLLHDAGRRVMVVAPAGGFSCPGVPVNRTGSLSFYRNLSGRSCIVEPENDYTVATCIKFCYEVGGLWLIVDEIDNYLPPQGYDLDLMRIVRYGRHRNLNLVGICQRPASVNKSLIAQADVKIFFRTVEPNDLLYIRKLTALDPDKIRALPDRRYLIESPLFIK